MRSIFEELGLDQETPSQQLARRLADADASLLEELRRAREERGLTQSQLGTLMGVSQATVSDFENGSSEPKLSTVRRYAHALDVVIEHSVRLVEEAPSASFRWESARTMAPNNWLGSFIISYPAAANNKRTDFARAA